MLRTSASASAARAALRTTLSRRVPPVSGVQLGAAAALTPSASAAGQPVAAAGLWLSDARGLSTSAPVNNSIIVAGVSVAVAALVARSVLGAYQSYSANKSADAPPTTEEGAADAAQDKTTGTAEEASASSGASGSAQNASAASGSEASSSSAASSASASAAAAGASSGGIFGAQAFARRFYKGGFEDKMTRREASLILGVRESATPERIRDRHRKMLMSNHPDTGGSTYLATKINEAKEVLIKGRAAK